MLDYTDEEREIMSACLKSYAEGMEKRVLEGNYGFYASDHDRVVKALLWEVEHMKLLAVYIENKESDN